MNRLTVVFALVLAMMAAEVLAQETQPSKVQIKKLVLDMVQAMDKGDFATIIDLTYPPVVEMMGGRQAALKLVETSTAQMKKASIADTTFSVEEPGDFHTADGKTYVLIPSIMELTVSKRRYRQRTYMLGVSPDNGKTWTFATDQVLRDDETRKKLFPNFPAALKLPAPEKPEQLPEK